MDAVKFLKETARMCVECGYCNHDCPINDACEKDSCDSCRSWMFNHPAEAVAIVEKWSEENPPESYKEV